MFDSFYVWMGEKIGGAWLAKGITALAMLLVTHGWLDAGKQTAWVQTSSGIALGILTSFLTWWRDRRKNQLVAIAAASPIHKAEMPVPSVLGLAAAQTPDVQTGTTFNGPSRVLPCIALFLVLSGSLYAQTSAPVVPTPPAVTNAAPVPLVIDLLALVPRLVVTPAPAQSFIKTQLEAGIQYVGSNGQQRAGMGCTLDQPGQLSPALITQLNVPALNHRLFGAIDCTPGPALSTLFSPGKTHMGLGIGDSFEFNAAWLARLNNPIFHDMSHIQSGFSIAPDADKAIAGRLALKTTVATISAGWKF